jgi:hypothetical protein
MPAANVSAQAVLRRARAVKAAKRDMALRTGLKGGCRKERAGGSVVVIGTADR